MIASDSSRTRSRRARNFDFFELRHPRLEARGEVLFVEAEDEADDFGVIVIDGNKLALFQRDFLQAMWGQSVRKTVFPHNPKVAGSNPAPATKSNPTKPTGNSGFLVLWAVFSPTPSSALRPDQNAPPRRISAGFFTPEFGRQSQRRRRRSHAQRVTKLPPETLSQSSARRRSRPRPTRDPHFVEGHGSRDRAEDGKQKACDLADDSVKLLVRQTVLAEKRVPLMTLSIHLGECRR